MTQRVIQKMITSIFKDYYLMYVKQNETSDPVCRPMYIIRYPHKTNFGLGIII